jgi:hypothetical protein
MVPIRRFVAALVLVPSFVACAAVLDIEQAKHDPSLDQKGGVTDAGGNGNASPLCVQYCNTIVKACTDNDEQYVLDTSGTKSTICLDLCSKLPPGADGDTSTDSVNCRLHYALEAAKVRNLMSGGEVGELDTDCRAAGPGGNGICGTNCEAFCTLAGPTCDGERAELTVAQKVVLNPAGCLTECHVLPDGKDYNDHTEHQSGDTVQCRLYHVSAAQTIPDFHCPHIGGASPCANPPGLVSDAGLLIH